MLKKLHSTIFIIYVFSICFSQAVSAEVSCFFSPGGGCTNEICKLSDNSTSEILVGAYQLTNVKICEALARAAKRGVVVVVLIDRGAQKGVTGGIVLCIRARVSFRVDRGEKLFHNKYMVFDRSTTLTGSFNFSDNAELRNAENFVVINDEATAKSFRDDFNRHLSHSTPFVVSKASVINNRSLLAFCFLFIYIPQKMESLSWLRLQVR